MEVVLGIYSGPGPIRRRCGEYTQGLDQSGGGVVNIPAKFVLSQMPTGPRVRPRFTALLPLAS
jgi:hypothetical protein